MRMTLAEVIAHEERIARGKMTPGEALVNAVTFLERAKAEREVGKGGLHEQIMQHCDAQWPRWKYIHSRTDQKSTVAVGSHDFTVFLPGGKFLCIECKAKDGKFSNEQLGWRFEMERIGHKVHTVTSLEQFLELTK